MRLPHPSYGVGDAFAFDDNYLKKKRDAERISKLEEDEKNRVETRKRKFFAEISNASRELQLQATASQKRRRQHNDGVHAWHARQRQRASRQEKLRFQALKSDDREAYMKMVEESKNERLTLLLGKTNDLLVRLGAAVRRQKDAEHDGIEPLKSPLANLPDTSATGIVESVSDEEDDLVVVDDNGVKTSDLLEGQRQYNSAIHLVQEKVSSIYIY
uniref:probable ATP-dependent DNA helicase CHR12 n=1 Tax=Erigeron canadensis TaxID=72917 RepID=UPI001CB8B07B|nr:probable ATP-dependent DNA helicase CHR12 [Erigeron canadensis]